MPPSFPGLSSLFGLAPTAAPAAPSPPSSLLDGRPGSPFGASGSDASPPSSPGRSRGLMRRVSSRALSMVSRPLSAVISSPLSAAPSPPVDDPYSALASPVGDAADTGANGRNISSSVAKSPVPGRATHSSMALPAPHSATAHPGAVASPWADRFEVHPDSLPTLPPDLFFQYDGFLRESKARATDAAKLRHRASAVFFRRGTEIATEANTNALALWQQHLNGASSSSLSSGNMDDAYDPAAAATGFGAGDGSSIDDMSPPDPVGGPGPPMAQLPLEEPEFVRILQELDISRITPRILVSGMPWIRRSERQTFRNNVVDLARFMDVRYRN
ncbi:hypothetical protein BC828DRAFT_409412, partial [Blastocladiella britannica]